MSCNRRRPEPLLAEMLRDPVVLAVMKRDGVTPEALTSLILEMRDRLKRSGALERLAA